MKAVITVTGRDTVGIIAAVSTECAKFGGNIIEISQSVLHEYFAMIMLVDIHELTLDFSDFSDKLTALGKGSGLDVHVMHEDIFNSMHNI